MKATLLFVIAILYITKIDSEFGVKADEGGAMAEA